MGKHVHRLSEKNFETKTAICRECGPTQIQITGNSYQCRTAYLEYRRRMNRDRRGFDLPPKDTCCARCGFEGEPCQLDQDHVNGDRTDHRPNNVQTLCANCHRLKSFRPDLF